MKACKDCIHFSACEDWVHSCGIQGLQFPFECYDEDNLCENYTTQTLPPAYIGMKVWVPHVWTFGEVMSDLKEGHVSGLQQKADKSWKIRVTRNGSVSDYTVEEFNTYCFHNKEDAVKYIEEKVKEYTNE